MININKLTAVIFAIAFSLFFSIKSYAAEPLVSVDWLKSNLSNEKLIVLEIRNKIDGG